MVVMQVNQEYLPVKRRPTSRRSAVPSQQTNFDGRAEVASRTCMEALILWLQDAMELWTCSPQSHIPIRLPDEIGLLLGET